MALGNNAVGMMWKLWDRQSERSSRLINRVFGGRFTDYPMDRKDAIIETQRRRFDKQTCRLLREMAYALDAANLSIAWHMGVEIDTDHPDYDPIKFASILTRDPKAPYLNPRSR